MNDKLVFLSLDAESMMVNLWAVSRVDLDHEKTTATLYIDGE